MGRQGRECACEAVRGNCSRTGVLPCEIRLRRKQRELEVCLCLEGARGSQRDVKTVTREGWGTSKGMG